jgi:hypothetical protein
MSRAQGRVGRVMAAGVLADVLAMAGAGGGGCQNRNAAAGGGATVASAEDLFAAKRYAEAKARAELDYSRTKGEAQHRSALIAGMASHACGKNGEAQRWLEPLLLNTAPEIAGRAAATLAIMAQEQKDPARAAALYTRAAQQLTGDDSARAGLRAGHAQTELNQFAQARDSYDAAFNAAQTPALKAAIQPYTEPGPFAVQVGVFSSKPNADRKAHEIQPKASQLGMTPTQVKAKTASGKTSFVVQVGRFLNRQAAVLAGKRLGTQAVVVPVGD